MPKQSQFAYDPREFPSPQGDDEAPEPIPYVRHAAAFLVLQQQVIALADDEPSAFAA